MKKQGLELVMACMLLVCFYLLSKEAALAAKEISGEKVILVDAGHGGRDPGTIGVGGLEEKDINLRISQKLKKALEKRGYSVVMTRETDEGLEDLGADHQKAQDMQRRIACMEKANPVLAVSIHQNSYEDEAVKGPQVFYYEQSREGNRLAVSIQEALNEALHPDRPRKAKGNSSYYLLKRSSCVTGIVECGFLTNPEEAVLLQESRYQEQVAEAIAEGIESYLTQEEKV